MCACTPLSVYSHRLEQLFDSLIMQHITNSSLTTLSYFNMLISRFAGLGGPVLTHTAQWVALILGCPTTDQRRMLVGLAACGLKDLPIQQTLHMAQDVMMMCWLMFFCQNTQLVSAFAITDAPGYISRLKGKSENVLLPACETFVNIGNIYIIFLVYNQISTKLMTFPSPSSVSFEFIAH